MPMPRACFVRACIVTTTVAKSRNALGKPLCMTVPAPRSNSARHSTRSKDPQGPPQRLEQPVRLLYRPFASSVDDTWPQATHRGRETRPAQGNPASSWPRSRRSATGPRPWVPGTGGWADGPRSLWCRRRGAMRVTQRTRWCRGFRALGSARSSLGTRFQAGSWSGRRQSGAMSGI